MMNVFPNQHLESIVEAFEAVRAEGPVNDLRVHFLDAQHNDFLPLAGSCPFCARSVKRSLECIFSEFGSDWLATVKRRPAESVGPECLLRFGVSPLRLAFGSSFCLESSTAVLRQ